MSSTVQDTHMGSASMEVKAIAAMATIDMSVDNTQGAEDGEVPDLIEVRKEEARQREMRRETFRKRLASNGSALRKTLMSETIKGLYSSPLRMEDMSIADIVSEIPDEDLPHVGTIQDRVYMTADFFRKWALPTIRVQKALKQSQDQGLPGGMEASMLASIFDQSVIDLNGSISGNLADIRALRAMVVHTSDDLTHQFLPIEEGGKALMRGILSTLQKLKQVAQFPDEDTLINMRDVDIESQNAEIAEAIAQYESHARRDNDSIIMLREQAAILAHLNLEQQIYICDLLERYLQFSEEKEKLVEAEDNAIYENLIDMNGLFTTLRESIEKRQRKVDAVLSPIDFSKILGTIKKLKSALIDGNILNTSLVKKNNSLQVEL
jgi:hypothetical protein